MSDLGVDFTQTPFHRIGFNIDEGVIDALAAHYAAAVFRTRKWSDRGKLSWSNLLIRLPASTYIIAHGDGLNKAEVISSHPRRLNEVYQELQKFIEGARQKPEPAFHMLRYDSCDLSAEAIEQLPEPSSDEFLQLCYGDDILAWITSFGHGTQARPGGLTIFDGPPGTGKTSLISQMIRRLEKTHVFYVLAAAQSEALASPEFVPFWQKENARHGDLVKVIVLEDAERLLWRRRGDNREAVSTLLNVADGLTGRMLRLHTICSVNASMSDLDPAILRPGRLMHHRQFKALSRDSAQRLAALQNLAFTPGEDVEGYTLAEVLHPGSFKLAEPRPRIGFHFLAPVAKP